MNVGTDVNAVSNLMIGSGASGYVDEVRVYSKSLSAAEGASLYRFPGGVEPCVVDGLWLSDASIIADKMAAENFLFTKAVGSLNKVNPAAGDVRSYLGKDPAGSQLDADPVGISIEEYNGENYETRFKAAMRSGGGVADAFVSGFFQAGESVLSSPGLIWREATDSFGADTIRGVAYGGGLWVAVGTSGAIARSIDGDVWGSRTYGDNAVSQPFGSDGWFLGVAYSQVAGRFVACGYLNSDNSGLIAYSDYLEAGSGIVEQGSNSNGHYVRFSSGVQWCWHNVSVAMTTIRNQNIGTYGWSYYLDTQTWTFPKPFVSTTGLAAFCSGSSQGPGLTSTLTTTTAAWATLAVSTGASDTRLWAIGYWK